MRHALAGSAAMSPQKSEPKFFLTDSPKVSGGLAELPQKLGSRFGNHLQDPQVVKFIPKEKTMIHEQLTKSEDDLLRRLGLAVKIKWGAIPPFAQDQILDQACEVDVWPAGVDVREALNSLLARKERGEFLK